MLMYFFAVGADIPKASATFRIVFFVQSFPVFLDLADQGLFFLRDRAWARYCSDERSCFLLSYVISVLSGLREGVLS